MKKSTIAKLLAEEDISVVHKKTRTASFDVKKREARIARNPKNGAAVAVPAKKVPFFRMGKGMKDRLNK